MLKVGRVVPELLVMLVLLQKFLDIKIELVNIKDYVKHYHDEKDICDFRGTLQNYKIGQDICALWTDNMFNYIPV